MSSVASTRPREAGGSMAAARIARRVALYALAALLVAIFMGPFLWTIASSLKTSRETALYPPILFPATPRWENYAEVFNNPAVPMALFALNSIQVAVLSVIGTVVTATLVAYGFSRFPSPTATRSSSSCSARS